MSAGGGDAAAPDWNPGAYARYRDLRLRPALDLMAAVRSVGGGAIFDLGCGNGAAGPYLRARFPGHRLVGVDSSPAMLGKAQETGVYDALEQADIADWTVSGAGLIFANAALHWVPDHAALMPRLSAMLAPGGTLAVQMPHQMNAPSHRVWTSLAEEMFPGRTDDSARPEVLAPARYYRMLAGAGAMALWETDYYQVLARSENGHHPVRLFTESTYARPILAALEPAERETLIRAYEKVMMRTYPAEPDGSVLFPMRRLFFTLAV